MKKCLSFFTRNLKTKIVTLALGLMIYAGLQVMSMTVLKNAYMFEWMGRNCYCYTWVLVILLVLVDKTLVANFVTFGTLLGVVIGELLGNILWERNMSKITSDMSVEQQHYLSLHHGVLIFVITLLKFVAMGVILDIILRKYKQRMAQNSKECF